MYVYMHKQFHSFTNIQFHFLRICPLLHSNLTPTDIQICKGGKEGMGRDKGGRGCWEGNQGRGSGGAELASSVFCVFSN